MKLLTFILLIFLGFSLCGQNLTPIVLLSGGGFHSTGKVNLSSSIGQPFGTFLVSKNNKTYVHGFAPGLNVMASPVKKSERDASQVSVFPNPAVDFIYVEIKSAVKERYKIEVYDLHGRQVNLAVNASSSTYIEKMELDVRALAHGAYFVRLVPTDGKNQVISFKVMKNSNM
jgi:hypothetical protein